MAYRAEIEIGVKGTEKLRELRNTVDLLAGKIDRLDSFADVFNSPIQSLKNYNQTLRTTAKALEQVELGQKDEATAIRQYVQALGQANTARARQNGLIQQEIALQEAAKREIQPGPTGFSRAQFGPALPPAFIKQQGDQQAFKKLFADLNETAKVISVSNTNTRTSWKRTFDELNETAKAISVSRLNTQASWKTTFDQLNETAKAIAVNRLNTQTSWQETFKQLNETAKAISVSRLNTQTSWQETFKQLNETAKAIAVSRLNTQTSWKTTFDQLNETAKAISVSRLNTRTSWQKALQELTETSQVISLSRLKTQNSWVKALSDLRETANDISKAAERERRQVRNRARRGAIAAGRERQARTREATSNALIGGAFPLLFGQGIGAAAGGAIGGGAGGRVGGQFGFALSLIGTSLGQAVDTFVQNVRKVSDSLRSPTETLQALEEVGFSVSDSVKLTVEELLKANKIYEAQAVALQEVTDKLGPKSVELLNAFSEENKKLNSEYERLAANITSAVLPALVGLTALLNDFSSILRSVEVPQQLKDFLLRLGAAGAGAVVPSLGQAQTVLGAVTTRGRRAAEEAGQPGLTPQLKALESEAADKAVEQEKAQERSVAVLESQYDLLVAGKSVLDERVYAAKQALIQQQYYKDINEEISKGLDTEMPKLRRLIALEQLRNERIDERKRLQEAAAREAAKAAREAERAAELLRRQQVQGFNLDLQGLQVNQATVAAETGPIAALNRQILDLTEKKTILENIAKLTTKDTGLLNKQLQLIAERISLEQTVTEQKLKQLELNTEAVLVDELNRDRRSLKDAQLETEAARVALTTPFDPAAQQSNELILSQLQESTQKTRELQDRREALANAVENASNEEKAGRKLVLEQFDKTAAKIQQELALRQELERALLKQNQLIEKYGFLANELSTAMTSAVQAVVTGTGTVEEAFSTMFANIGKAFIDMATQMLAQKLFMTVLGALGGGGGFSFAGGSASSGLSAANLMGGTGPLNAGLFGRASGGSVSPGSTYMVGERGPELLTMTPSGGYVTNNSASQAAMDRYSGGNTRGGSISVNYNVTEINGMKFVTEDQFRAGISQAAKQGADGGFNRTMSSLKNSRSTRSRVGV